jgi:hypothetical protein
MRMVTPDDEEIIARLAMLGADDTGPGQDPAGFRRRLRRLHEDPAEAARIEALAAEAEQDQDQGAAGWISVPGLSGRAADAVSAPHHPEPAGRKKGERTKKLLYGAAAVAVAGGIAYLATRNRWLSEPDDIAAVVGTVTVNDAVIVADDTAGQMHALQLNMPAVASAKGNVPSVRRIPRPWASIAERL